MSKAQSKQVLLKSCKEKDTSSLAKEKLLKSRKEQNGTFEVLSVNSSQPRWIYSPTEPFKTDREIRTFQNKNLLT